MQSLHGYFKGYKIIFLKFTELFAPCRGIQNYGHKKQEPNFLFALLLVVHSTLAGVKST